MLKNRKVLAIFIFALFLQGCSFGNNSKTASSSSQNTSNKTQTASSTAKSSNNSSTSSEAASTDEQNSASSTESSTDTGNSSTQTQSAQGQALLKKLYETSKSGKIPNCNFSSNGTLIQTVEKSWGKPDKTNVSGKNTYYTYNKYGVVFGARKDSKIFNIRLYGKNFDEIRYNDVENILGKSASISHYKGEATIIYNVNKDFQLALVFYEPDSNNSDPALQYVSVTCQKVE